MKKIFGIRHYEFYGLLILLLTSVIIKIASEFVIQHINNSNVPKYSQKELDSLQRQFELAFLTSDDSTGSATPSLRFPFDPNSLGYDSLLLLGFSEYSANNIVRYRNSGGVFYSKEKLLQIYGVDTSLVHELETLFRFPVAQKQVSRARIFPEKKEIINVFDLNKATQYDLMQVKGIGEKLSRNILKYRDYLGGYYSKDQLFEVYGLAPEVVEKLIDVCFLSDSVELRRIKVNKANFKELVAHPYIDKSLAIHIDAYLKKSYFIASSEEMQVKVLQNDSTLLRVLPYLDFSM